MKNLLRSFALFPMLAVLMFVSCEVEDAGLTAPTVTLPSTSTVPSYTADRLPADDAEALSLFQQAVQVIETNSTDPSISMIPRSKTSMKSLSPRPKGTYTFYLFDAEKETITLTDDTTIINGASLSGTMSGKATFTYANEETYTVGDNFQISFKMDLKADLQNVTGGTLTVKGVITLVSDTGFTMRIDKVYPSGYDFDYTLSYNVAEGFGYAISVSNSAPDGAGGKFLLAISYADSGSMKYNAETMTFTGTEPGVGALKATLTVYDNSNVKSREIVLTEEQISDFLLTPIDYEDIL